MNDDDMMTEIMIELNTIKKTKEITRNQVLAWMRREEGQRCKKALIEATKENKEFHASKRHK